MVPSTIHQNKTQSVSIVIGKCLTCKFSIYSHNIFTTTATSDVIKSDYFNSSYSPQLLRSDSSFEIIDDDEDSSSSPKMALNSLSSIRTGVINPLQDVIVQNKQLKELLEDCRKKMASVKEDQDVMLQKLDKEKSKCNDLEGETLRLQLEITSLHQVESIIWHEFTRITDKLY